MATKSQSSTPLSRLSRLGLNFGFRSNPASPLAREPDATDEDWYIPYNGPYEPPRIKDERDTDSWGHLVSGWLMENGDEHADRPSVRMRAMSSASRPTTDEYTRGSSRARVSSLNTAGGVGESPMPVRREQETSHLPSHHRSSFASILSFGQSHKRAMALQHSTSVGHLRPLSSTAEQLFADPAQLYSKPEEQQQSFPRPHPYAYAAPVPPTPAPAPGPVTKAHTSNVPRFAIPLLDPLGRRPTAPAYLKPVRRPSRLSIKASLSTPNLRHPTAPPPSLPKGKQRWLSAETWCDALILPRPRFALRTVDGHEKGSTSGSSGRIVSPPGSPIWPASPSADAQPQSQAQTTSREEAPQRGGLKKAKSAAQLAPSKVPVQEVMQNPSASIAGPSTLRAPRPKSFALDDLALPSPVPSLAKVLEDGRQLEQERKAWQAQATRSFQNKRVRSVSRARSKSLGGGGQARIHRHDAAAASAFDILAERTLLGNQARAPTVHVRPQRSQSQSLRGSDEHGATTISGSGVGANTSTSTSHQTHTRTRSRSHAHSNSAGSVSLHPSNESFMWTPGHGRNHSIGKSALRLVRTTATTAAGLCGFAGGDKEKDHVEEKWTGAGGIEDALRRDGTKVIRLHDQLSQEERGDSEGIVVITPPAQLSPGAMLTLSPGGPMGVSPTPSGLSASGEGVGLAISSPPRSEDHSPNYPDQEPIRIPAHPYAQGAVYSYNQPSSSRAPVIKRPPDIQVPTIKDGVTRHRQPILVHPYSPYAQGAHPYAAPTAGQSAISSSRQHLEVDPHTSMFAELSPGKIRVIQPEEIQYSPFTPVPTVVIPPAPQTNPAVQLNPTRHPYGPSSKRVSEWGFAEALSHTLLGRGSTDSGLGTSEDHENALPDSAAGQVLPGQEQVDSPVQDDMSEMEMLSVPKHGQASSAGRGVSRDAPRVSSNHTLASSPMDSINPPLFRRTISATSALQSGNSSGSSPGMVSHESSPPLSPRPINTTEDLERFRDLFYNPPAISPEDTSISSRSRRPSGSIPIDIGSRSTRSLSGLTTLARQLSENLEELRELTRDSVDNDDRSSPMWSMRLGGMRGSRPDDMVTDFPGALSQSSSDSSSRHDMRISPLRLPIDEHMTLTQPSDDIPEDVESSRASSELEVALDEEHDLRLGAVEALSTPPLFATPKRFSTHLSVLGYQEGERSPQSPHHSEDVQPSRIMSQQSSLAAPLSSDAARSSFMTNTSRMSGLSDFPAPPTNVSPGHMSLLSNYYGDKPHNPPDTSFDFDFTRPTLVREPSRGTFGGSQEMGEAL